MLSLPILFILVFFPEPTHYTQRTLPEIRQTAVMSHATYTTGECTADKAQEQIQYAWRTWRDYDFILTVSAESMWDSEASGDKNRAFGYCQVRKDYNQWGYDRYKAMETWQEKLEECRRMYKVWKDKGIVHKRLYGYNRRQQNKLHIICN